MLGARLHRCTIATVVECHSPSYIAEAAFRGRRNQTMLAEWTTSMRLSTQSVVLYIRVHEYPGLSRTQIVQRQNRNTNCLVTSWKLDACEPCSFCHRFSKIETIIFYLTVHRITQLLLLLKLLPLVLIVLLVLLLY